MSRNQQMNEIASKDTEVTPQKVGSDLKLLQRPELHGNTADYDHPVGTANTLIARLDWVFTPSSPRIIDPNRKENPPQFPARHIARHPSVWCIIYTHKNK